jgi:uncharacterized protein (TIGR03435 family)
MLNRIVSGAAVLTLVAGLLPGQKLEFEVASIKPAAPIQPQMIASGKVHLGLTVDGSRVDFGGLPLLALLPMAFRVKAYQVSGPDWLSQERFDIIGKIPDGATKDQVPDMLQALLADRFKLVFHRENKEHPVYALVVAKGGTKLKPAIVEPEPASAPDDAKKGIVLGSLDGSQSRITQDSKGIMIQGGAQGTMRVSPGPEGIHMEASAMTIASLVDTLTPFLDRPVVDLTDVKGQYQITLDLSLADVMKVAKTAGLVVATTGPIPVGASGASPAGGAPDPSSSSIFAAVQSLGLKLEPRKLPVETIVVDHMEKAPTEN